MNKKLGRLLQPRIGVYFLIMLGFSAAAAALQHYVLAAAELGVTALAFVGYMVYYNYRHRELQAFLQKVTDEMCQTAGAEAPFPIAVIRLSDNGIVYANERFIHITGFRDTMSEVSTEDVLPGFSTQWLLDGKAEYPYDVTVGGRRYRVYGTSVRADDP